MHKCACVHVCVHVCVVPSGSTEEMNASWKMQHVMSIQAALLNIIVPVLRFWNMTKKSDCASQNLECLDYCFTINIFFILCV